MFITGLIEVAGIGILPIFIQLVVNPAKMNDIAIVGDWYAFETLTQDVVFLYGSIAVITIIVLKNLIVFGFRYIQVRFSFGLQVEFGRRLFRGYLNAPYLFHVNLNSAHALNRLSAEIKIVVNQLIITALTLVSDSIMALMVCLTLFLTEAQLTTILFAVFLVSSVIFFRFVRNNTNKYGRENQLHRDQLLKTISQGLGGLKEARIMKREKALFRSYNRSISAIARTASYNETVANSIRPFFEIMVMIAVIIITTVLMTSSSNIEDVLPILTLFAMAALKLMPTINQIMSTLNKINYNKYALDPVYNDLSYLERVNKYDYEKNKDISRKPLSESIDLTDVHFTYPDAQEEALRGVDLTIKKGEAIGFVGGSGAGKSTLIDLIIGLIEPTKGTIEVDRDSIHNNLTGWQLNIGYIPQSIYLADDTIEANIAFCVDEVDQEKLKEAEDAAHVTEFLSNLPEGRNTIVGEQGARLSGGQRQRIGIARAIYNNPEVLVMDEATSALDNVSERIVVEAIEELKGQRTILMIAHRLSTVKNCDRIVVMENGRIVAIDTYDNLLKNNKTFQKMALKTEEHAG
jgi:ATP-binding cassette subfamily C protein